MKRCPRCNTAKEFDEFRPNRNKKDGFQQYCKPCDKEYQKNWYRDNAERLKAKSILRTSRIRVENRSFIYSFLKSHPCIDCGEADPVVLEFHHIGEKANDISAMLGNGYSLQTIKEEISKCAVICANCHRRRTARDFNWYKNGQSD